MARALFDRQKERWAYIRREDAANTRLVIFIHGFRGSYLTTWGDLNTYLQQHADTDNTLAEWDYLFLGYETATIGSYLEIADIITSQWRKASTREPPFDKNNYAQLALFGHSLGTLAIRQLLCAISEQPQGMLQALKATVLFGSPLNGSSLASLGGLFKYKDALSGNLGALLPGSYRIARALEPGNPELKMLQVWNKTVRTQGGSSFLPTKVILGTDDRVVGTGDLAEWLGDVVSKTSMDHSQLCKIDNVGLSTQGTVLDLLRGLANA
jgi:pimeloyl-ACP methyl ester carboxylesterase